MLFTTMVSVNFFLDSFLLNFWDSNSFHLYDWLILEDYILTDNDSKNRDTGWHSEFQYPESKTTTMYLRKHKDLYNNFYHF